MNLLACVEERLNALLTFPSLPEERLYEAARYAVFSGGKRLRPLLTLGTVQALQGDIEQALQPACALELIHTYSLIHDDLPCMDDDDFRRGMPTVHKKFDEGCAVLAGDFLLTYAFQVLADAPHVSMGKRLQMIRCLAERSGGSGMIGGQILDLKATNSAISLDDLSHMHQKKTGQLLIAALELGGIVADATDFQMQHLLAFGKDIGLAFQIMDDVIDVISSEQKHGKKISSDAIQGKTTYVTQLGLEKAKSTAETLLHQALDRLANLVFPKPLEDIAISLVKRST